VKSEGEEEAIRGAPSEARISVFRAKRGSVSRRAERGISSPSPPNGGRGKLERE
jgi:hypothetical protein